MVTVMEFFSTPYLQSSSSNPQLTVPIQLVLHRNRTRLSSAKQNVQQQKGSLQVKPSNKEAVLDALPKLKQNLHWLILPLVNCWRIYSSLPGKNPEPERVPHSEIKAFAAPRRTAMAMILSTYIFSRVGFHDVAFAQTPTPFKEYIDTFDGYTFFYPKNWIQVKGAGADIFFRDPYVLDENISVEFSSPSSSSYKSVKDLGSPEEAAKKVLKQYLTEFMSTRLGVRRESNVVATSSRVADDGRLYYQVEVNIKSYASNNELAVMPQDRVVRLEWDRRYLSVLGVENNRLYELRLQTPENVFIEEEGELRRIMESFRVNTVTA